MFRKVMLVSVIVSVLATFSIGSTEEPLREFTARVEKDFTVWHLWLCSEYQQAYDWPTFVDRFAQLNNKTPSQLNHLLIGTVAIFPQAQFGYDKIDPEGCHVTILSKPVTASAPKDETVSLTQEVEKLKAAFDQGFGDFGTELEQLEKRIGAIEEKIPTDFKPIEIEAATSEQSSTLKSLEDRLTKAEAQLVDIKIGLVDWPLARGGKASPRQPKDQALPIAPTVIVFLSCLTLAVTGAIFYSRNQRKKLKLEQERKTATLIEKTRKETVLRVERARGNLLAETYRWKTIEFETPRDLRTMRSSASFILVRTRDGNEGGENSNRPQVLAPCYPEKKTPPIFLKNLPNHIRHCETCREKLFLQEIGSAEGSVV